LSSEIDEAQSAKIKVQSWSLCDKK